MTAGYTQQQAIVICIPSLSWLVKLAEGLFVISACIHRSEGGVQNGPAGNLPSSAIFGNSWERLRKFWFSEVNFTHLCRLCGA